MGPVVAVALVGAHENIGASVSEDHWRWEQPASCWKCGQRPQSLYMVELSDGSTVDCGVACAAKLLNVTTAKVYAWRRRHGRLEVVR
jgi:hypothetical protein